MVSRITRNQSARTLRQVAGAISAPSITRPLTKPAKTHSFATTWAIATSLKVGKTEGLSNSRDYTTDASWLEYTAQTRDNGKRKEEPMFSSTATSTPRQYLSNTRDLPRAVALDPARSQSQTPVNVPPATTSISMLVQEGFLHLLKTEPRLAPWIDKYNWSRFGREKLNEPENCFESLVTGVISQQISAALAIRIKDDFISLFYPESSGSTIRQFPTPEMVLAQDIQTLKKVRLSQTKAEYIQNVAKGFKFGTLNPEALIRGSDEEVIERLTSIKGIGIWSTQMFIVFHLGRLDAFSTTNLDIQRGIAAFIGRDVSKTRATRNKSEEEKKWKYMSENEMLAISDRFRPYRSLLWLLMLKVGDASVERTKTRKKKTGEPKQPRKPRQPRQPKEPTHSIGPMKPREPMVFMSPDSVKDMVGGGGEKSLLGETENRTVYNR